MKIAFDLSEQFDRPFVYRTTTRLAHSQGLVELCDREEIPDKPYEKKYPQECYDAGKCETPSRRDRENGIRSWQRQQIHFRSTELR